jgi:GNAT superfamily N-acetyltransferase
MIHSLRVEEIDITRSGDRKRFVQVPWKIYRHDPHWVAPLISERMAFLDPSKNHSFDHMDTAFFVAQGYVAGRQGAMPQPGQPVVLGSEQTLGTICAFVNHRHNEFHDEQVGFFGFFETVNDPEVAHALLQTACDWVREQGMLAIRGPASFTGNDDAFGMLVDGFDRRPVVLMSYNPPYYPEFVESFGFQKAMDLWAWYVNMERYGEDMRGLPTKLLRIVDKVRERTGVQVRKINIADWDAELARVKRVYNSAWENNWGFVPPTEEEFDHLAEGLRQFIDPDVIFMAEINGEPVGFSLPLPDMCIPLSHMRSGRLFPTGWAKFLWYKRQIDWLRIFALGVVKEHRGRGIDALLYYETGKAAYAKGYRHIEMSWILENNDMMNRAIQMFGAEIYKTYRMYEMAL